ncbi:MAG: M15 family metallopeptidase [Desulfovibrio sp.]|nr:M15 family metallopeptidase [Desulfovibrio sp.]MCR5168977.1 M15 family metallopeptidase [Desulfovibrio sp.]
MLLNVFASSCCVTALLFGGAVDAHARAVSPEDSSGFVLVKLYAPEIQQEIRYYSTYNFVGERIAGYEAPCAILTKEATRALKHAADELAKKGYGLKIYDAYRPQKAVTHFVNWAKDLKDTRMQRDFYPDIDKSKLLGPYIAPRSGHSRGSTVDVTLTDLKTGKDVDMGGTFDFFGAKSHPDYKGTLSRDQLRSRRILRDAMERSGFRGIKTEWWHYTLKNEPYPNTYFTFPVSDLLFLPDKEKATPSAAGDPKPDTVAPADPSKAKPEEAASAQPAEKPAP